MLRLFHALWLAVPAAMLGGCPVYPDGCAMNDDCDYGYFCDYPSGTCQKISTQPTEGGTPRCRTSEDCDAGLVCDRYHRCAPEGGDAGAGGTSPTGGESGSGAPGTSEGGTAGG